MQETNKKIQKLRFVSLYLTATLISFMVFPSFGAVPGLPSFRPDDILLIAFPLVALAVIREFYLDFRVCILILIGVAFFVGYVTGSLMGYPASLNDLFFVFRISKYIGATILALTFAHLIGRERALLVFCKLSLATGMGVALVCVQQYFDIGALNAKYVHLVSPTQYETLVNNYPWPRPIGMVGNPNEVGYFLVLLGLVGSYLWIKPGGLGLKWKLATLAIFAVSTLTLSRSSIFAGITALFIMLVGSVLITFSISKFSIHRRKMTGLILFFLALLSTVLILLFQENLYNSIGWRFTPGYYGSFIARQAAWMANYEGWQQSIFFGIGPLRHAEIFDAGDNEHLLLLRTGGLMLYGLVLSLLIIGFCNRRLMGNDLIFQIALIISLLLYMIPSAVFYSLVIFPWLLMFLVLLAPLRIGKFKA
jgi:hypothetical protein